MTEVLLSALRDIVEADCGCPCCGRSVNTAETAIKAAPRPAGNYVVICYDDLRSGENPQYVAAIHRLFDAEGAAAYASKLHPDRHSRVVTAAEYVLTCGRFRRD